MAKILLIEDDKRLSSLLANGLEEAGFSVNLATNGELGLEKAMKEDFDLVITDILMPVRDGLSFCKEIKKQKPSLPVIMLTALGTTNEKLDGFDAGADDYQTKPFEMLELIARVKVLLKRSPQKQNVSTLKYHDVEINLGKKHVTRSGIYIKLTPKEFNLLVFMMENSEKVLSRNEISEKVWGIDFDTGTNFIDVYINYLRKKIDKGFDTKLIHTKSGMGFILQKDLDVSQ